MKEDEVVGKCSMPGWENKCLFDFDENLKERSRVWKLRIRGKILLKWIVCVCLKMIFWFDCWGPNYKAFVTKIINFSGSIKAHNLLSNWETASFSRNALFLQILSQTDRQTDRHEFSVPVIVRVINVYNLFLVWAKHEPSYRIINLHFSIELSCLQKNWIEVGHLSAACYTTRFFPKNLFPIFPS